MLEKAVANLRKQLDQQFNKMIVSGQMQLQDRANKDLWSVASKLPPPSLEQKLKSIFLFYSKIKLPQAV